MEKFVQELPLTANVEQFWGAIQIYTEKPHVLNRKICGTTNIWIGHINQNSSADEAISKIIDKITHYDCQVGSVNGGGKSNDSCGNSSVQNNSSSFMESEEVERLKTILLEEGFQSYCRTDIKTKPEQSVIDHKLENEIKKSSIKSELNCAIEEKTNISIPWEDLSSDNKSLVAVIRKIHPKQLQKYIPKLELVLLDAWKTAAMYICKLAADSTSVPPHVNYSFKWIPSGISLSTFQDKNDEKVQSNNSVIWLKTNVVPKLVKWTSEIQESGLKQYKGSLSLVNIQEYNELYQTLKVKYGQPLVEAWTETTNPQKFVFEDVAIATYLILLWKKERETKGITDYQTFVDLGCGNGVLVYILTSEGHKGLGVDLKKRNIWDMFPSDIKLMEGVVEPSDKHLFPDYDWLIGNHSDELTPWLPVIASKSKYTTCFFVIPCCAHDFDCKYKRKHTGISQYADYIKYVKEVGNVCGFQMLEDKLRIPSTKRVCLIGQERTYNACNTSQKLKDIDDFIKSRNEMNAKLSLNGKISDESPCNNGASMKAEDALWSANFKARERLQPVRNCTRLKEDTKNDLISTIVSILLEKKHIVEVDIRCPQTVAWDQGGRINLSALAERIGHEQLSALKKECGGLQTLLRNHRNIFSIIHGDVGLQVPVPEWKAKVPKDKIKTKHCWFHRNHYQNCPLPSSACIYAHGDDDVRQSVAL